MSFVEEASVWTFGLFVKIWVTEKSSEILGIELSNNWRKNTRRIDLEI